MNRLMNRAALLAVMLLLILPIRVHAEETSIVFTEEVQLKLADAFMEDGDTLILFAFVVSLDAYDRSRAICFD